MRAAVLPPVQLPTVTLAVGVSVGMALGRSGEAPDELIARAEAGEEIVIKRHGAPVAKLVAVAPKITVEERRKARLDFQERRRLTGPRLGLDLTIKQLIEEGRR